jgi:methyl-accepting chemotaxis protein
MSLFKKSKISTKIIIPVILLLLSANIISTYLSSKNMNQLVYQNSQQSLNLLTDSIFVTLRTAMNSGDSKVIKDVENEIRKTLKGLENLTVSKSKKLIDMYSSNEALTTNKNILDVINTKKEKLIHTSNNIQIIRPMLAKQECLSCHPTHNIGETIGVISLTFSISKLTEQIDNTIWLLILTALIVLCVTIFILVLITKKAVNPIDIFSKNLKQFFMYLNGDIKTIEPFEVIYEDEVGQMVKDVNINIEKTMKGLQKDQLVIKEAKEVIDKVKSGFCAYTINSHANNEGINELKDGINSMVKNMKYQLDEILKALIEYGGANFDYKFNLRDTSGDVGSVVMGTKTIANNIAELFATVLNTGEKLSLDIQNLSTESERLATSSSQQASSIEQTVSAVLQIGSNMQNSSKSVSDMSSLANEVNILANDGELYASQTASSMDDINDQVNAINNSIAVIDKIAFQTNILSLNAAVEAATAGEAGKGFAVVAQEVRNLASRSTDAAKDIKDLVQNAIIKTDQGKEISNKMIVGYSQLNKKISQTKKMIDDVTLATSQQQYAIAEVNRAIDQLETTTQQNVNSALYMEELSLDIQKLSNSLLTIASDASFDGKIKMQVCDSKLTHTLNKLKLDHIYLKDNSFSQLNNYEQFFIQNHHECDLGVWIDEQEKQGIAFTKTSNWDKLKYSHIKAHETIQEFIDLNAKGIDYNKLHKLGIDTEKVLDKTLCLLDQVKVDHCKQLFLS